MVPARLVGLKTQRAFLCGIVTLCLSGCGGSSDKEEAAPPETTPSAASAAAPVSELFRGIVNIAAQPARIVRCATPDTFTVNDAAAKLAYARTKLGPPAQ